MTASSRPAASSGPTPVTAWPASSSATAGSARCTRSRPGSATTRSAARSPRPPVPEGLDWDFWKGPTADVPYVKERCHYEFRWWYDYSGGKLTDWGAHHNDIAQWGLGMDGSGPVERDGHGRHAVRTSRTRYNCHPHFAVTYRYANGAHLITTSDGENGNRFIGDKGWIFVNRERIEASDPKLLEEPLPKDAVKLYVSNDHMGNFIDGIRTPQAADLRRRGRLPFGHGLPPRRDRAAAGHPARLGPPEGMLRRPARRERATPWSRARCDRRGGWKSEIGVRSF